MVSARYFEIGDRMAAALPELADEIAQLSGDYEANLGSGPGPINLIDEVLTPAMRTWLADAAACEASLRRAFGFLEELAADPEAEIREVAQITANCLAGAPRLDRAAAWIGPRMREMFQRSRS
jgi:hypothetical protein